MKKIIEVECFDQSVIPQIKNENHGEVSIDVIIIDELGLNGVGYYNFKDNKWYFHTDTLVDYFEEGNPTKFYWYYPPFTSLEVNKEIGLFGENHKLQEYPTLPIPLSMIEWFLFKRPFDWSEEMHIEQWQVNCPTQAEKNIAIEVVNYLKRKNAT